MTSAKQVAANQANAQLSTGPVTPEGKAKSALNAVKSGLTGQTVLLPTEDAAAYEAHIATVTARYEPVGPAEKFLVQAIADADWRIQRIRSIEDGFYCMGRMEFASNFDHHPEIERAALIRTATHVHFERQLRNLAIQENRLRRHRDADLEELAALQVQRRERDEALRDRQLTLAARSLVKAVKTGTTSEWVPVVNGFVFSIQEISKRLFELDRDVFASCYDLLGRLQEIESEHLLESGV